mmetsp:Transcript_18169/g.44576  ORF Transcript_18169/g.44576 Transcript_18169/m.44576 type:complete len:327 (+) Transcript_18169:360-1340(+)
MGHRPCRQDSSVLWPRPLDDPPVVRGLQSGSPGQGGARDPDALDPGPPADPGQLHHRDAADPHAHHRNPRAEMAHGLDPRRARAAPAHGGRRALLPHRRHAQRRDRAVDGALRAQHPPRVRREAGHGPHDRAGDDPERHPPHVLERPVERVLPLPRVGTAVPPRRQRLLPQHAEQRKGPVHRGGRHERRGGSGPWEARDRPEHRAGLAGVPNARDAVQHEAQAEAGPRRAGFPRRHEAEDRARRRHDAGPRRLHPPNKGGRHHHRRDGAAPGEGPRLVREGPGRRRVHGGGGSAEHGGRAQRLVRRLPPEEGVEHQEDHPLRHLEP